MWIRFRVSAMLSAGMFVWVCLGATGCAPQPVIMEEPGVVLGLATVDGSLAAGVDEDGLLRLFNRQGECVLEQEVSPLPLRAVAATGQIIAVGGDEGRVRVYRLGDVSLTELADWRVSSSSSSSIRALAFEPGRDDRIAVASADGIVRIFDALAGIRIGEQLVGHQPREVLAVTYGPSETKAADWLVSGGGDMTFRIFESDASSSIPLRIQTAGEGAVNGLAFSSDGALLVTATADGRTRVWRTEDAFDENGAPTSMWSQLRTLIGHSGSVNTVATTADGAMAVTGGDDGAVIVWDLSNFEMVAKFRAGRDGAVTSLAVLEQGDSIAIITAGADGSILVDTVTAPAL